jgi:glycosyltransferase involved in cell wall biosynthesis
MCELISIIVPIFKVESYLPKCLDSIINQSYKNLEIILVDDGSPDNCGSICEEYAKKDSRIKVIHKENGGLSDARNSGIEVASGKYIGFVDSDDFIHKDMYKVLYETAKRQSAEIVECQVEMAYVDNIKFEYEENYIVCVYDNIMASINLKDFNKNNEVMVWNKLYDSKLFNNIRFPKGKIHEDEFTTYKLFYIANRIATVKTKMYYYRQNPDGIMCSKFNIKRFDILEAYREQMDFYKENNLQLLYDKTLFVFLNILKNYYYLVKHDDELKKYSNDLKKEFNNHYIRFLYTKNFSFLKKAAIGLFAVNPNLYEIYISIRNRNFNCK